MNFKNWLEKLEEAKGNYSPQGNIFQGVQHGYGAMYGADRAGPPPIGWGFNNLAAASFIDGIGKARSKEREEWEVNLGLFHNMKIHFGIWKIKVCKPYTCLCSFL